MKSGAAQTVFKFLIGAALGFGVGLGALELVREHPMTLGLAWLLVTVGSGLLGVRVFSVEGKFSLVRAGEENRLRPSEEVMMVIGYVLLGVLLQILL